MFVDSVLQSLGCVANLPTFITAHVFVYDIASLKGKCDIRVDCRKNKFGGEYQRKFSDSVAITHRSFDLFLQFKIGVTYPRKF